MGLLDVLNSEQGRLGLGLLAAGGARSDGANFGQRMQEGIGSVDQWKAQQQLSQQRQMQIDEAKRQQEDAIAMREMAARFKTPAQPGRPAIPAAPEFGIPTALSAVEAKPEGYDYQGFANAMAERNPQASWSMLQSMAPKAPEAYTLGEGQTRYIGGKVIARGPEKQQKDGEFITLLKQSGIDPMGPEGRALIRQRLDKEATHQSPVSVSYGAPVAGVDAAGKSVFFQPGKNGGAPLIIPGVAPSSGGEKMTEDQSKASGWLVQAGNAYSNMKSAMKADPSAAKPGVNDLISSIPSFGLAPAAANMMRGAERQKFIQSSSSLSEALLRAATGAGVNKDEALQKIQELTPIFGEDEENTKQKMAAIPLYIKSLEMRAGPGAKKANSILTPGGGAEGTWQDNDPLGLRK